MALINVSCLMSHCNSILKRKTLFPACLVSVQTCLTSFRMFLCDWCSVTCSNLESFLPPWSMLARLLPPTPSSCLPLNAAVRMGSRSSQMWRSAQQQADLIVMFSWISPPRCLYSPLWHHSDFSELIVYSKPWIAPCGSVAQPWIIFPPYKLWL